MIGSFPRSVLKKNPGVISALHGLTLRADGGNNSVNCACCLTSLDFGNPSKLNNKSMLRRQAFTTNGFSSDDDEASPHVKQLLDNNKRWVGEVNSKDPDFFSKLARPQEPKYLYFGCSDSRVPANEILGLGWVGF